jgi:hypothetical protein
MTAIADEHGHILLRNRYEYGVLVRQDYANGDVYDYAYLWSPTRTLADKVRVTLPDRSVREIWVADTVPGNLRTQ